MKQFIAVGIILVTSIVCAYLDINHLMVQPIYFYTIGSLSGMVAMKIGLSQ